MDRYKKELQAISKMKYSDIQKEKLEVGKAWAKAYGKTFASVTVGNLVGLPFYLVFIANLANVKQNIRIGKSKRTK